MGTDVVQAGEDTVYTGADTETTVGLFCKECGDLDGFKEWWKVWRSEC